VHAIFTYKPDTYDCSSTSIYRLRYDIITYTLSRHHAPHRTCWLEILLLVPLGTALSSDLSKLALKMFSSHPRCAPASTAPPGYAFVYLINFLSFSPKLPFLFFFINTLRSTAAQWMTIKCISEVPS